MAASWIDRALAIRTVDEDDVPTDGKFRIWKFVGATLVPDGDRLVITISGGQLLSGGGGSVDLRDGGFVIDATAPILVSAAGGISIDVGDLTIETPYHVIAAQAPTLGAHLTNKAYVDALIAAGVPSAITNNASITGPGAIAIAPAAGFDIGLRTAGGAGVTSVTAAATGAVVVSASDTDPLTNPGEVRVRAETKIMMGARGATGGISLRAGNDPNTPGTDELILRGDATLTMIGPVSTLTATTSATIVSPAVEITGALTMRGRSIGDDWLVVAIADANVNLSAPGATINGATMTAGDVFAVVGQSTDTQNGVYTYVDASSPATRHPSFDAVGEYKIGTRVRAATGTNEGLSWYLNGLDTSLPASWVALPGGSGGGGASISDSGASVDTTGGDVLTEVPSGGEFRVQYDGDTVFRYAGGIATIDAPGDNVSIAPTAGTLDLGGGGVSAVTLTSGGTCTTTVTGACSVIASGAITRGASATGGRVVGAVNGTTWEEKWYGTANTLGLTIGAQASGASITTVGPLMLSAGSTYAVDIGLGGTVAGYGLYSAGSHAIHLHTNAATTVSGGTGLTLQGYYGDIVLLTSGAVKVQDASYTDRTLFRSPPDTATTDATLTTLANLVPTARPSTYPVVVHAWDASLNVARWRVEVGAILRGGAAVIIDASPPSAAAPTAADAALSTCALTVDTSTTNVRLRGAGVAATNLTWACTVPGEVK